MGEELRLILVCALLGRVTWRVATKGGHPIDVIVPFACGVTIGFDLFH